MVPSDRSDAYKLSLFSHRDDLQCDWRFFPDCDTSDYILKQSIFITNHYLEARNESLSIFNNSNFIYTGLNVIDDSITSSSISSNTNQDENILSHDRFQSVITNFSHSKKSHIPLKSKFVKSKYKKYFHFIPKEISCISIKFITSIFIDSVHCKLKDMKLNCMLNTLKSSERCILNYDKNEKICEQIPKVVVERASTSTITFGSISALRDFDNECENQGDVCFNNSFYEAPLKKLRTKCFEYCEKFNNVCNQTEKKSNSLKYGNHKLALEYIVDVKESQNQEKLEINNKDQIKCWGSKQNTGSLKRIHRTRIPNKYFQQNFATKVRKKQKTELDLSLVKKDLIEGKGPIATVVLQKLSDEYVQKAISKVDCKSLKRKHIPEDRHFVEGNYSKPAYILSGLGTKLSDIPKVEDNIWSAGKRAIRLIHHILFGRVEQDDISRWNILEFNGYSECQKTFVAHRQEILKKMHLFDIKVICKIFLLKMSYNKLETIKQLLEFLHAPSVSFKRKNSYAKSVVKRHPVKFRKSKLSNGAYASWKTKRLAAKAPPTSSRNLDSNKVSVEMTDLKPHAVKLKSLYKICFNVECAAPEDLSELNDLLFVRPSDSTEIHQKILEFCGFPFSESSFEYQYRKTLLHYMDFGIIKKIALLLDISSCEEYSNKQELSSIILKFLMEPKEKCTSRKSLNISPRCNPEPSQEKVQLTKNRHVSPNYNPVINRLQVQEPQDKVQLTGSIHISPSYNPVINRLQVQEKNEVSQLGNDCDETSTKQCSDHAYSRIYATKEVLMQQKENSISKEEIRHNERKASENIYTMPTRRPLHHFLIRKNDSQNLSVISNKSNSIMALPYHFVTRNNSSSTLVPVSLATKELKAKTTNYPLITKVQAL